MKIKYYNSHEYEREVRILENKLSAYNKFLDKINELKPGAMTIEEVQKYLNGKTKFVNPLLSADAMGVKDLYNEAIDLESVWIGLNLNVLEKVSGEMTPARFKISGRYLDEVKEKHTTYYTPTQEKQIDSIEQAIEILNKLDLPYRASLAYHPTQQKWMWAKQHTDNNIAMNKPIRG